MALPSGSGTEVLKRHQANGVNDAYTTLTVPAHHIYTILSMTICETGGATETFDLYIDDDGGGTDYEILSDQAIGANETFIWNERLVLSGTDHLCMITASSANIDVVITYIDQDWS